MGSAIGDIDQVISRVGLTYWAKENTNLICSGPNALKFSYGVIGT